MTWFLILFNFWCVLCAKINEDSEQQRFLNSRSSLSMVNLVQIELKLLANLDAYAKDMQQKLDMARLYQQMLERPKIANTETQEEYVTNPLNGFALLRRLQQDWPKWLEYLQEGATQAKLEEMKVLLQQRPGEKNLQLAIEGLLNIEDVYDLEVSHMAQGLLLGNQYESHLISPDCLALGNELFNQGDYSRSTHWLRNALRLYKSPYAQLYSKVLGLKRKKLYRLYALAIARETHRSEKPTSIKTPAEWQKIVDDMLNKLVLEASNADIKKLMDEYLAGDEEKFIVLRSKNKARPTALKCGCRGLWPERPPNRLTCSFLQENSLFLRLAPLKMEILNLEPRIVLYHQVLTDNEIEILKQTAQQETEVDQNPIKIYNFAESCTPLIYTINQRISDMMRMTITDQTIRLFNYGLGAYLDKQKIAKCAKPKIKSNSASGTVKVNSKGHCPSKRLATIAFYASNVTIGGATIFPNLKLIVPPKKGNALVWYHANKISTHAVCPVLLGSRWGISKCIDEQPQLQQQPCLV